MHVGISKDQSDNNRLNDRKWDDGDGTVCGTSPRNRTQFGVPCFFRSHGYKCDAIFLVRAQRVVCLQSTGKRVYISGDIVCYERKYQSNPRYVWYTLVSWSIRCVSHSSVFVVFNATLQVGTLSPILPNNVSLNLVRSFNIYPGIYDHLPYLLVINKFVQVIRFWRNWTAYRTTPGVVILFSGIDPSNEMKKNLAVERIGRNTYLDRSSPKRISRCFSFANMDPVDTKNI